ncbi:hypothetical protein IGI04_023576, partial [Brassica rapa subsp. trilocularis]
MLHGVYYPLCGDIDSLTTHMNAHTRPSIDSDHTSLRGKLVTEKFLHDKLDEITFSQDLLKEDIYQELKDISESTHARLGMQQCSIGNLQHRINASEVARERLKNQWTGEERRGVHQKLHWYLVPDERGRYAKVDHRAKYSHLLRMFERTKLTSNLIELNLLVLGLGIHWIRILLQVWK